MQESTHSHCCCRRCLHWNPARALLIQMHVRVHTLMLPPLIALEPMLMHCRYGCMQEFTLSCCRRRLHWSSRSCIADTDVRRSLMLSYCCRCSHWSLARALPIQMHAGVHTFVLPSPITLELTLVYSRYGCMQEFNALILPSPFLHWSLACVPPIQMYSTPQVSHTTAE